MVKPIIIDGNNTGWFVSDEGYTIDTWGRKSYGTINRTAGYMQVCIQKKKYLMHRLVAEFFIPKTEKNPDGTQIAGKLQVNHKNENRFDNSVENLEWCDNSYNNRYGTKALRCVMKISKKYKCVETGDVGTSSYLSQLFGLKRQAIRNAANKNDSHTHANGYHFILED